jgi:hypothetical protein
MCQYAPPLELIEVPVFQEDAEEDKSKEESSYPSGESDDDWSCDDDSVEVASGEENDGTELAEEFRTPQKREEWRRLYRNKSLLRKHLLKDENDGKPVKMLEGFVDSLTAIGLVKDDAQKVKQLNEVVYRWRMYKAKEKLPATLWKTPAGITTEDANRRLPIPKKESTEWPSWREKAVLELKTSQGRWKSWLSLRRSTVRGAGAGVFAERTFDRNTTLGFYVGAAVWTAEVPGAIEPGDKYLLNQHKIEDDVYDFVYRDSECKVRVTRAEPLGRSPEAAGRPLFMGLHYMNNHCHTFVTKRGKQAARAFNKARLMNDGSVKVVARVHQGEEIFAGYRLSEEKKPKATAKREGKEKKAKGSGKKQGRPKRRRSDGGGSDESKGEATDDSYLRSVRGKKYGV